MKLVRVICFFFPVTKSSNKASHELLQKAYMIVSFGLRIFMCRFVENWKSNWCIKRRKVNSNFNLNVNSFVLGQVVIFLLSWHIKKKAPGKSRELLEKLTSVLIYYLTEGDCCLVHEFPFSTKKIFLLLIFYWVIILVFYPIFYTSLVASKKKNPTTPFKPNPKNF